MSDAELKFNRQVLKRQLDLGTDLLLLLEDSKTQTMTDEALTAKLQAVVDAGVLDYYFSLIIFCKQMVAAGKIVVPQQSKGIVIPQGSKTH